jgi:hypothetical protein
LLFIIFTQLHVLIENINFAAISNGIILGG